MTKQIVVTNNIPKSIDEKHAKSIICAGGIVLMGSMILPEAAFALDFQAGATAFFTPISEVVTNNWGKVVGLSAGSYAMFGEGDLRQKAIKAGIGAGLAGGIMLAIEAVFV